MFTSFVGMSFKTERAQRKRMSPASVIISDTGYQKAHGSKKGHADQKSWPFYLPFEFQKLIVPTHSISCTYMT